MGTGSEREQLGPCVQLRVLARSVDSSLTDSQGAVDRCLRCLEVVHCPVLSHPPPDYTGSKQAKSQRTMTVTSNETSLATKKKLSRLKKVFGEKKHSTAKTLQLLHINWMLTSDKAVSVTKKHGSRRTWNTQGSHCVCAS